MRWALVSLLVACNKQPASTCDTRVKAFDDALAASAAGTCSTDADCKCFPGGVSEKHGCGGVTDGKTAATLDDLAKSHRDAKCKSGIACAAWVCSPSCQAGKCTNGPPPKVTPPAPTQSASPTASAPASSKPTVTCDARVAELDRVLAAGSRKCKTDKDCVCFRGGISKTSPCGDITDAKTNERLEAIAKEWTAAGCKNDGVMCPAMVCQTTCNGGTCGAPTTIIQ